MNYLSLHTIDKFLSGNATPDEKAQIEAWYQSCQKQKSLTESLTEEEMTKTAAKMWSIISGAVQSDYSTLPEPGAQLPVPISEED